MEHIDKLGTKYRRCTWPVIRVLFVVYAFLLGVTLTLRGSKDMILNRVALPDFAMLLMLLLMISLRCRVRLPKVFWVFLSIVAVFVVSTLWAVVTGTYIRSFSYAFTELGAFLFLLIGFATLYSVLMHCSWKQRIQLLNAATICSGIIAFIGIWDFYAVGTNLLPVIVSAISDVFQIDLTETTQKPFHYKNGFLGFFAHVSHVTPYMIAFTGITLISFLYSQTRRDRILFSLILGMHLSCFWLTAQRTPVAILMLLLIFVPIVYFKFLPRSTFVQFFKYSVLVVGIFLAICATSLYVHKNFSKKIEKKFLGRWVTQRVKIADNTSDGIINNDIELPKTIKGLPCSPNDTVSTPRSESVQSTLVASSPPNDTVSTPRSKSVQSAPVVSSPPNDTVSTPRSKSVQSAPVVSSLEKVESHQNEMSVRVKKDSFVYAIKHGNFRSTLSCYLSTVQQAPIMGNGFGGLYMSLEEGRRHEAAGCYLRVLISGGLVAFCLLLWMIYLIVKGTFSLDRDRVPQDASSLAIVILPIFLIFLLGGFYIDFIRKREFWLLVSLMLALTTEYNFSFVDVKENNPKMKSTDRECLE